MLGSFKNRFGEKRPNIFLTKTPEEPQNIPDNNPSVLANNDSEYPYEPEPIIQPLNEVVIPVATKQENYSDNPELTQNNSESDNLNITEEELIFNLAEELKQQPDFIILLCNKLVPILLPKIKKSLVNQLVEWSEINE